MPRLFDGTDDVLKVAVSTPMNVGFGTFAAILRCSSFAATRAWMRMHTSGGTNGLGVFFNTSAQVGYSNAAAAPAGTTALSVDTWYLVACGKATGSNTPRVHIYNYGTNAWTHENTGAAITDATAVGTTGSLAIGARNADQFMPGDIAIAGFWASNLTDGEVERLPIRLPDWYALAPTGLWLLDQGATTMSVPDLTGGGGNQTSLTGTAVSSNAVPLLTYGGGPWLVTRPQAAAPGGNARRYSLTLTGVG